ncbi:MAG: DNA alkylation repair protein [bacterium]
MLTEEIRERLFSLRDEEYRAFQGKLLPTVPQERLIGVRTPALRALAKELGKREDIGLFLAALPHTFFDENQLHAFLISEIKAYPACLAAVEAFLPGIDNWATCDQLSPKAFRRNRAALLEPVRRWLASGETYTIRFGIKCLMEHYLDEDFDPVLPALVASVRSEEYYVRMMVAWYFATALAKQYEAALPYLEARRLDPWTHSKTIQKAIESYRIPPERKATLRGLKSGHFAND